MKLNWTDGGRRMICMPAKARGGEGAGGGTQDRASVGVRLKWGLIWPALTLIIATSVGSGYAWRAWQDGAVARRNKEDGDKESLVAIQSFSEIENAKAMLSGLSFQYMAEISARRARIGQAPQLKEAVREVERAIEEFSGTEEEVTLLRVELGLLKEEEHYDRWLDVYLRVLYEHPTQKMVGCLAEEAIALGRETGRQNDLKDAFEHLIRIPLCFAAKEDVKRALARDEESALLVRGGS